MLNEVLQATEKVFKAAHDEYGQFALAIRICKRFIKRSIQIIDLIDILCIMYYVLCFDFVNK
jgi:hypothetical protein